MSWPSRVLVILAGLWLVAPRAGLGIIHARRRQRARPDRSRDPARVARLILVGLAGGLNLSGALGLAAESAPPGDAAEIRAILRAARTVGLASALAASEGSLRGLWGHLARAQVTGAALAPAVRSFLDAVASEERNAVLRRSRSLPVRLVPAIALLLLPGFVLVVMGPGAARSARDLLGVVVP